MESAFRQFPVYCERGTSQQQTLTGYQQGAIRAGASSLAVQSVTVPVAGTGVYAFLPAADLTQVQAGDYLVVTGASAGNNGALRPITAVDTLAKTITVTNPSAVAQGVAGTAEARQAIPQYTTATFYSRGVLFNAAPLKTGKKYRLSDVYAILQEANGLNQDAGRADCVYLYICQTNDAPLRDLFGAVALGLNVYSQGLSDFSVPFGGNYESIKLSPSDSVTPAADFPRRSSLYVQTDQGAQVDVAAIDLDQFYRAHSPVAALPISQQSSPPQVYAWEFEAKAPCLLVYAAISGTQQGALFQSVAGSVMFNLSEV